MESSKAVTIDGLNYTINYYPAEKGTEIFARLMHLLGRPLLMGMFADEKAPNAADQVGQIVFVLTSTLTPKQLVEFQKEILSATSVQSEDGGWLDLSSVWGTHFRGRQLHIWKLILATIEFQFADFYDALKALFSKLVKAGAGKIKARFQEKQEEAIPAKPSRSPSRPASPGSSGVRSSPNHPSAN